MEYNGGVPPVGPTPWLTAQFDDHDTPGSVTLTLTGTNLSGTEFLRSGYFNLDPALNPGNLTFSTPTQTGMFDTPTISLGSNAFKADGDGFFDILLEFSTSDGPEKRFTSGDSVSYAVGGIAGLTASAFNFISAPDGAGRGLYPTAAHVQNTGVEGTGSAWVTVPEPGTLSLLALGGLALIRRGK
ncbi:MAG: PEP-CTERM sorting domain-containing protein [Phycisphaerae bacterium]|nr:PEP-CTERM sorting domain-containing protein [Phycisphaerae bacterium]